MKKSTILCLVASFVLLICAASCSSSKTASTEATKVEPIKIGSLLSLTSSDAVASYAMKLSTQMAEEDINAGGGVLGRPIKIIIMDDQLKADLATTLTRKLISDEKVVGLVGAYASATGLAAAAVCKELQVPIVGIGMSDAGAKPVNPYAYCYHIMNYYALRTILTRIKSLGHTKLGYYYTDSAWGTGGLETLNRLLAQPDFSSLKLVTQQGTPLGATDVTLQVTKMKESGIQAVVIMNYGTETAAFYRAKKVLNWKPYIMSVIGVIASVMNIIPVDMAAGTEVVDWFAGENNPAAQSVATRTKARFPDFDPKQGMAYVTYDEPWLLVEAIKRSGSTNPKAIRDALEKIRDWKCISAGAAGSVVGFSPTDHVGLTAGVVKVLQPDGVWKTIGGEPSVNDLLGF